MGARPEPDGDEVLYMTAAYHLPDELIDVARGDIARTETALRRVIRRANASGDAEQMADAVLIARILDDLELIVKHAHRIGGGGRR